MFKVRFSTGSFAERLRNLPNRDVSIAVALLLALIFANNVFHFSQYRINKVFDQTSEGLVVGRLARSAADGVLSERAELGTNYREKDPVELRGSYSDQIKYFEHPELIKADDAQWVVYPSQFGLQGIFFALVDSIDPLPRRYRIGLYHFLSALICAAAFMWVAFKIRDRFGLRGGHGLRHPGRLRADVHGARAQSLLGGGALVRADGYRDGYRQSRKPQTKMVADRRRRVPQSSPSRYAAMSSSPPSSSPR